MAREVMKNQPLLTEPELRSRLGELYAAIDQFNRRWYFESHETLEDLWMVTPLPERDFMQGIIQLAAAFVHFARGEYPGMFKLLDQSLAKLGAFAAGQYGVDVARLIEDAQRARAEIEALGVEQFREWDERDAPIIAYRAET
jgi:predicted metal-dependent hydrolase